MKFDDVVAKELKRRGWSYAIESSTGRYEIAYEGGTNTVCLDNLRKEVSMNGDVTRVKRFFDSIAASRSLPDSTIHLAQLFWALEPNNYHEKPYIFESLSEQVDQVLVHLSADEGLITFVTSEMLAKAEITEDQASDAAFDNLDAALSKSVLDFLDIEGSRLGYVSTHLPFKSALILSPKLREFAESLLGWPLLAVIPDRDFLYLWSAQDSGLTAKLGSVVLDEYFNAPYSVSTEVFEIDDEGIGSVAVFTRSEESDH